MTSAHPVPASRPARPCLRPVPDPGVPLSVWATAQHDARTQRRGRYLPASTAHPAKMLPAIAATAITRYTRPGDLVADPMCGIGTTLVEAIHLGRDAIGVEYEARWARIAAANITHARRQGAAGTGDGDPRRRPPAPRPAAARHRGAGGAGGHLPAVRAQRPRPGPRRAARGGGGVEKYDNRYSDDPANLAHHGLDDLLAGFTQILGRLRRAAAPRRDRRRHRPALAAARRAGRPARRRPRRRRSAAGLIPAERCVALLAGLRGQQLIARPSFFQLDNIRKARARGEPWHLIVHEDVLVFRAPAFPGSSRELKGPQRELKGPAPAILAGRAGVAGELGAAA